MSVEDICRDVRLFLKGLARELPGIFPVPHVHGRPAPRARRAPPGADALRKNAKELIRARVEHWASVLNLEYNRISVKDQRTIWGSCSVKKNLNFYWRLAAAPEEILDYIVIHELCHLREMNHSKNFWALVHSACPEYSARRKWLRENCAELRDPGGKYASLPEAATLGRTC